MSSLIAALDSALAGYGEDIILRRVVGTAPNQVNIDVTCRARVDAVTTQQQLVANITVKDFNVILSPTQINNAQWPGGQVPIPPPINEDPRIPRVSSDKAIVRHKVCNIAYVDAKVIDGELVRIELRVSG